VAEVDAARDHRDAIRRPSHPHELEHLVGGGGDDVVGGAGQLRLDGDPLRRAGVGAALLPAPDDAEGVVRVHHRDAERTRRLRRHEA
jgi:hypothetical protein